MDELQLLRQILSSLTVEELRVLAKFMFLMAFLNAFVFFAFQFVLDTVKFFVTFQSFELFNYIRKSSKSDNSKN
jgi:hypothetical protein